MHNVETMFYAGKTPWHGLGTPVPEALSADDALRAAQLNWQVVPEPVQTETGTPIPGYRANVRASDGAVLGLVSDRYRIVQNDEAFAWLDELVGEAGLRFETAGALGGGKRVWMTARLPEEFHIAGDPTTIYLTFTNGHDGRHAVQVAVSPVRVVCQNTLNLALNTAPRQWSAVHTLNIHHRMDEARKSLQLTNQYLEDLRDQAETWTAQTMMPVRWKEVVREILPDPKNGQPSPILEGQRLAIESAMYRPDQAAFAGTAWGAVNAVAWFASHRQYPKNPERAMATFIDGDQLLDRLMKIL